MERKIISFHFSDKKEVHAAQIHRKWRRNEMVKTIFIAVIGVLLVGLSVWMWWFDNYGPADKKEKGEDKEEAGNGIKN